MLVHALRSSSEEPDDSRSYRPNGRLTEVSTAVTCFAEAPPPGSERVCLRFTKRPSDDAVLERWRHQHAALVGIDHPALPVPHAAGLDWAGRPYFVMDAVDGQDIHTHCDRHGLDLTGRLALIAEACEAVGHAHARGLAHGAIEPGDVIVCDRPASTCVRVLGTGVASILGSRAVREPDAIIYRSPEQVTGSAGTEGPRSDVYALGVVAYELVVGAPPHDRATLDRAMKMGMLQWTYEDGPPALCARACMLGDRIAEVAARRGLEADEFRQSMGGELQEVIARALSPDPSARQADAGELGRALRGVRIG